MALTILTTYDPAWWGEVKLTHTHDTYEDNKKALLSATLNKEHRLPLPEGVELIKLREKQMRTPLSTLSVFAKPQFSTSAQPKPLASAPSAEPPEHKGPGKL